MNFRGRGYFDRRNGEFSIGVDKNAKVLSRHPV